MHADSQKICGSAGRGLSASLILYSLACPISRSANYFPLASLLLFALYLWFRQGGVFEETAPLKKLACIWVGLVVWRCITIFLNGGGLSVAPVLKTFNILPLFLLYRLPCNTEWKDRQALYALFVLLSVTSATIMLGLVQKLSGIEYPFPEQPFSGGKLIGFLGYHIHAGGFFSALAVLSFCLVLFWRTTRGIRTLLAVLLAVLVAGFLFSMSRTYYVSLLLILPLILLRKSLKTTVIGTAFLLLTIVTTLLLSPSIRERALSIADVRVNQSNVERLYLWKVARDMILDKPVAGVGFKQWGKNLSRYTGRYAGEWQFTPAALHHAHNVYLNTAAETGLVGLALFLGFWLYLLYLMFHEVKSTPDGSFRKALTLGAAFALFNLLIGGMFEENFGSTLVNIFLIPYLIALSFFISGGNRGGEDSV